MLRMRAGSQGWQQPETGTRVEGVHGSPAFAGSVDPGSASRGLAARRDGHGLVLRRAHASRAAHHKGYGAVGVACGDGLGFLLLGLSRRSGQALKRYIAVAFSGKTAGVHPENRDDITHKLDERAQHRCQPLLGGRWGTSPLARVRAFVMGAIVQRLRARPVLPGSYPTIFPANALDSRRKIFGHPTKLLPFHPAAGPQKRRARLMAAGPSGSQACAA